MFPNFETVMIPRHKPEVLLTLTDSHGSDAYNAAIRSQGNIRNFFTYLDGYDEMDDFKTPKEFIADVLTDTSPLGVNLLACTNAFSTADVFDTHMYQTGNWHLMPYFVLHALTVPKVALGEPLDRDKIRPGSCWTKLGNYKMRKQKFSEISKKSRMGLGVEELCLLKKYAENGDLEPLLEYKITPQDFDVINHLAVGNGLKSKDVTRVKKALKNAYDRR
jgi:hypothetical protein